MADPRRPARRRGPKQTTQPEAPTADKGVGLPDQDGAILSVRVDRSQEPQEAPVSVQRTSGLREDDLLALASMDPAELAALMDGAVRTSRIEVGDRIRGVVSRLGRDTVFVDVGHKAEGQLSLEELPEAKPGDSVEAYVLNVGEWGVSLSTKLTGQAASVFVEEAFESGIPVEGKVVSRNPGGFEVRVGSLFAFCPISHIDRLLTEDLDVYVGQTLQFKVLETGEKLVLSRREHQEEQLDLGAAWEEIAVGQIKDGVVASVQDFGVFVDMDGLQGLVHKSQLSWEQVDDPRRHFSRGQAMQVRVLEVDRQRQRLSLSAKDPQASPWLRVQTEFAPGSTHQGTVKRVEPYGAFVELAPGLQGLLHVSNTPSRQLPGIGEKVDVQVLEVDLERRRIGLGVEVLRGSGQPDPAGTGTSASGTIVDVLRNGVVVELADGRTGWLPAREVELPAGTVLAQRYRRGRPIEARIIEDDPRRSRVVLSARADADAERQSWAQAVQQPSASSEGFGTLGDLLKGKLR